MSSSSAVKLQRVLTVALLLGAASSLASAQCEVAKLTANDGAPDDRFGYAVGISADTVVVGGPWHDEAGYNRGGVYVYERVGATWPLAAKLLPNEGVGFGRAVALDCDVLVVDRVGAWTCVFERSDGRWSKVDELVPDDYEPGEALDFGHAVAVGGQLAIAGAPLDNDNGGYSGSAYVFEQEQNATWLQVAKLLPDDGEPGEHFGTSVALSGNVAVIGAPDDDDEGNYSGSAYVFERDEGGNWSQVAKLLAADGGPFHSFGASVAVSGNVALVGAYDADGNEIHAGAAYVFEHEGNGGWTQTAKLTAADGQRADRFGIDVGIDGDLAVVGARGDDDLGYSAGSAYVFVRDEDGSWSQVAKLLAEDGAPEDRFGKRVAVSGNVAVVAAYTDDDHGEDSGSAYVFAVGPDEDGDGVMDACECPGDLDHDWIVDYYDLALLLADWGCTSGDCPGDCDRDGDTDHADLGLLLANWGEVCP